MGPFSLPEVTKKVPNQYFRAQKISCLVNKSPGNKIIILGKQAMAMDKQNVHERW